MNENRRDRDSNSQEGQRGPGGQQDNRERMNTSNGQYNRQRDNASLDEELRSQLRNKNKQSRQRMQNNDSRSEMQDTD
jgi:hypothetical protein